MSIGIRGMLRHPRQLHAHRAVNREAFTDSGGRKSVFSQLKSAKTQTNSCWPRFGLSGSQVVYQSPDNPAGTLKSDSIDEEEFSERASKSGALI